MIRKVWVDEGYDFSDTITFILCYRSPARMVSGAVCMSVLISSALLLSPAPPASQQQVTVVRQDEQVMAVHTQAPNLLASQSRVLQSPGQLRVRRRHAHAVLPNKLESETKRRRRTCN